MNELDLLTRLRDEVPLTSARPAVETAVLAAIREPDSPGGRLAARHGARQGGQLTARHGARQGGRRGGVRVATAGSLALVAIAVGVIAVTAIQSPAQPGQPPTIPPISWSGRPTAPSPGIGSPSLGTARTEAELVDYATRVAATSPGQAPGPHEWVFIKTEIADSSAGSGGFLFGPPDRRLITLQWVRVDWREYASGVVVRADLPPGKVVHARIDLSPGGGGTLGAWRSVSYSYLASLPTDPARLESVILAYNDPRAPRDSMKASAVVFGAISDLLQGETEGVWMPPKLAATLYRVLQRLPGVQFDAGTDLAGRAGIGLYLVMDGWLKQELVINPETYTFMGEETVAVRAHTLVGTDGTRHLSQGQILGWMALLESAIVRHPGQVP